MNAQKKEPRVVIAFELDHDSFDPEELEIVASILADLWRDTETNLQQGEE